MRTRRNLEEPILELTNEELRALERTNRKNRKTNTSSPRMNPNNNPQPGQTPTLNPLPPPPGGNNIPPPDLIAQYEARMQQQNNVLALLQQQMTQMMANQNQNRPRGRTIGEVDDINDFYQNRSAIVVPAVPVGERRNAELRSSTISLVKQSAFNGLTNENPLRHIEQFEALVDTTQATGASLEYFRCTLFPFSLAGKAEQWLGSLPPGSLTSWIQCRAAFLKRYYTKGKTAQLRSRISGFRQMDGESFTEAWGRFKDYIRECPHHSFMDEQLMRIFYDGVNWNFKIALNSASRGDFATQSAEEARELIENMASSLEESSPEYDRTTKKVQSVSTPSLEELAAQVQELLRQSGSKKEVHMVAEPEAGCYQEPAEPYTETDEEVNYVNGQGYGQNRGFNPNYRNHPNLSYRSTNVENPQDQVYPPAPQQQQVQPKQYAPQQKSGYQNQQSSGYQNQQGQGYQNNYGNQYQPRQSNQQNYAPRAQQQMQNAQPQQPKTTLDDIKTLFFNGQMEITKAMEDVKGEIRTTRTELESKLEALETRVKMAETQVAQTAESMKRQPGSLPGRGENPRKDMCSVAEAGPVNEPNGIDVHEDIIRESKVEKLGDPGPLNLQIEIRDKVFTDCLCDLGASVNLMSHSAAKSIGLSDFEPTSISLRFADSSEKRPLGVVVDLPVKIDKVHVPTDFVVLELENESKDTIILGRPFLNTTGAVINTREGSVVLDLRSRSTGQPLDPGDGTSSHMINYIEAFRPRPAAGEDEWLRRKPDKGEASVHDKAVQLEPKTSPRGKTRSTPPFGTRSVTRPPDPSHL